MLTLCVHDAAEHPLDDFAELPVEIIVTRGDATDWVIVPRARLGTLGRPTVGIASSPYRRDVPTTFA